MMKSKFTRGVSSRTRTDSTRSPSSHQGNRPPARRAWDDPRRGESGAGFRGRSDEPDRFNRDEHPPTRESRHRDEVDGNRGRYGQGVEPRQPRFNDAARPSRFGDAPRFSRANNPRVGGNRSRFNAAGADRPNFRGRSPDGDRASMHRPYGNFGDERSTADGRPAPRKRPIIQYRSASSRNRLATYDENGANSSHRVDTESPLGSSIEHLDDQTQADPPEENFNREGADRPFNRVYTDGYPSRDGGFRERGNRAPRGERAPRTPRFSERAYPPRAQRSVGSFRQPAGGRRFKNPKPPQRPTAKTYTIKPKNFQYFDEYEKDPRGERVQKVLAQNGLGSRREIEGWIAEGRITINDEVATLGARITARQKVYLDGKLLQLGEPHNRILLYHKPEGEVVSHDDPQGRSSVFDGLPRLRHGRWQSVGRLDINSSGLLIITTSGELAHQLSHPRFSWEREYAVRVLGEVSEEELARLRVGIDLQDGPARAESVEAQGGTGLNRWYKVIMREGRYREVRRMFEALNHAVSRLMRIRFGPFLLPAGLKRGHFLELGQEEVDEILALCQDNKELHKKLNLFEAEKPFDPEYDAGFFQDTDAPITGDLPVDEMEKEDPEE